MKLVLLPGLDGTGDLFAPLLTIRPDWDALVIPLPESVVQDYSNLAEFIEPLLPDEPFILLAESFSGGIALELSKTGPSQLQGIIFIASFLHSPAPILARVAKYLPIKTLAKSPLSSRIIKWWMLGNSASDELVGLFRQVIDKVSSGVLRDRLRTISELKFHQAERRINATYIAALNDRLVSLDQKRYFESVFGNLDYIEVGGPHFILQAVPETCAVIIDRVISESGV